MMDIYTSIPLIKNKTLKKLSKLIDLS